MAKRRMFSLDVVDTDAFLEMPASTQALYFHLGMRADDEGFVSSPKRITALCNCGADDLKLLNAKGFIIPFESGVCVISHWKINNYLQSDRRSSTVYITEKNKLQTLPNRSYVLNNQPCIQDVSKLYTQYSIDKDSIDKDSIDKDSIEKDRKDIFSEQDKPAPKTKKIFSKPSLEEVTSYCKERGIGIDPQQFMDYYDANGWRVGKNPMNDWKAAVRRWERNSKNRGENINARTNIEKPKTDWGNISIKL